MQELNFAEGDSYLGSDNRIYAIFDIANKGEEKYLICKCESWTEIFNSQGESIENNNLKLTNRTNGKWKGEAL